MKMWVCELWKNKFCSQLAMVEISSKWIFRQVRHLMDLRVTCETTNQQIHHQQGSHSDIVRTQVRLASVLACKAGNRKESLDRDGALLKQGRASSILTIQQFHLAMNKPGFDWISIISLAQGPKGGWEIVRCLQDTVLLNIQPNMGVC